jgi:hypothetical protein
MNHFTDKDGFNGIRSQPSWIFKASQPPASHHPVGAYFTTYEADEPHLAKKLFLPRSKLAYIFAFTESHPLSRLPGGRGRLGKIWFSPVDYLVPDSHRLGCGETGL